MRFHQAHHVRYANTLTHGVGALASFAALAWLVLLARRSGDALNLVGATVFGLALVALYTSSALYHGVTGRRWKRFFMRCDYAGIFLLIGGTYTGVILTGLRHPTGWALLTVVWALCLAGVLLVADFRFPGRLRLAATFIYLGLGCLVLLVLKPLIASLPGASLRWLLAGGACYTCGVVFFLWRRLPYHHAIWHLFVLAGSGFHFLAVADSLAPGGS